MSKVTRKRLRELAMIDATATPDEVRSLVLEVKGARAMIERFAALQIAAEQSSCVCADARATRADSSGESLANSPAITLN